MNKIMKRSLALKIAVSLFFVFLGSVLFAQQPELPPNYPPALCDESKVPKYTLPGPLVILNGEKVNDTLTWKEKRRPEILKLFETHVYGRAMIGRPKEMGYCQIHE